MSKPLGLVVVGAILAAALAFAVVALTTTSPRTVVPSLRGTALSSAEGSLASIGLKWTVVHRGRGTPTTRTGIVLAQVPSAGTAVKKGETIQLNVYGTLTNGPTVAIPNFVGMLEWRAENAITDRGLTPVVKGPMHAGTAYQLWTIVSQSPRPGASLPVGAGTVVIRMQGPIVAVTARVATAPGATSEAPGIHVVAAYRISSAQLRLPPISDAGPLSRQA